MIASPEQIRPEHSRVYRCLCQFHTGRSQSITAAELGKIFSLDIRAVAEEIRRLRYAGLLIGSSKTWPAGYYIPANAEEVKDYFKTYAKEMFDMLSVYNRQKRASKKYLADQKNKEIAGSKVDASGQLAFI